MGKALVMLVAVAGSERAAVLSDDDLKQARAEAALVSEEDSSHAEGDPGGLPPPQPANLALCHRPLWCSWPSSRVQSDVGNRPC